MALCSSPTWHGTLEAKYLTSNCLAGIEHDNLATRPARKERGRKLRRRKRRRRLLDRRRLDRRPRRPRLRHGPAAGTHPRLVHQAVRHQGRQDEVERAALRPDDAAHRDVGHVRGARRGEGGVQGARERGSRARCRRCRRRARGEDRARAQTLRARAPKPSAAPAPAPRAKKKGEKRKKPERERRAASAARRRRRSSAERAATTAIVVASPARGARTPRDSARMRNLAEAALLAAKASVQKRLPPKKRGLAGARDDENASDVAAASPASVSAGRTPRLASPRRRRGGLILAPSFRPPERAAAAARERAQAIADAAAEGAKSSSSSSSHGTRRRVRPRRSLLGGIARRLSDGLLGVLSRAGRPAGEVSGATLVPAVGPGWRWSTAGAGGGEDGAIVVARKSPARPRATAEAVDVSVGEFRAAMAAAGVVVQHRVRLSLAAAGEE